ncbi:MAG: hypothetical protein COA83_09620 [Methylophaga sp.]|nr:MAG: hypothetical protein COA83_09620 [Methylophaga sp.]
MTSLNETRAITRLLNNLPLVDQHDLLVQLLRDSKPSAVEISLMKRLGDVCDKLGVFTPKFSVHVQLNEASTLEIDDTLTWEDTDIISPDVRVQLNEVMNHANI